VGFLAMEKMFVDFQKIGKRIVSIGFFISILIKELFFLFSQYDFDYSKRQNEWSTTNSKTDFYKLVLSWSPSFCKQLSSPERNRSFQCQYDDFGLIV